MEILIRYFYRTLFVYIIVTMGLSCVPISKLRYFNDINELQAPVANPRGQKVILPFDRVYIQVFSIDERTNLIFSAMDNQGAGAVSGLIGYLVDENGNIDYPFTGKIKVSGFTTSEAAGVIQNTLNQYFSATEVIVKIIDNSITLLGEVQQQGVHSFSQERLNIYEALALGGGLTNYGDRKRVILIREEDKQIRHYRLDLSDSRIAGRDNYYVRANDVIVVEPLRNLSGTYGSNTLGLIFSSISMLISILIFTGFQI